MAQGIGTVNGQNKRPTTKDNINYDIRLMAVNVMAVNLVDFNIRYGPMKSFQLTLPAID